MTQDADKRNRFLGTHKEDPDEGRILEPKWFGGWMAVLDADNVEDEMLNITRDRLESQGVEVRVDQNKEGVVLKRKGGYLLEDKGPKPETAQA